MQKTGKLELTWVGKYDEVAVEPRILIEDPSKSYGDPNSENMLIHGDNLIALRALEQDRWRIPLLKRGFFDVCKYFCLRITARSAH